MATVKTIELIEGICKVLDCSQRRAASLLGFDPHTITNNQDKPLSQLTPRTRIRIAGLYHVVVSDLGILRSEAIQEIIQSHVFPDIKGRMDSVLSAIQGDKYPIETLIQIAEISKKRYQEKMEEQTIDIADAVTATA